MIFYLQIVSFPSETEKEINVLTNLFIEILKIHIIPIGDIPKTVLRSISEGIKEVYSSILEGMEVEQRVEPPSETYDPRREQYRAEVILQYLSSEFASKEGKVLAITSEDLYAKGLNFIFGQAQKHGKFALISLHRLRPEFWGDEKKRDLFLDRAVKEAIHELGHSFGLEHCENMRCVMTFSNRIEHTDRKKAEFCEECKEKLETILAEEV
ncbi:MAG: archaemetzincin family Zn-dependent metalloprotease [Candidatus Thermoplasmatota archaeon]